MCHAFTSGAGALVSDRTDTKQCGARACAQTHSSHQRIHCSLSVCLSVSLSFSLSRELPRGSGCLLSVGWGVADTRTLPFMFIRWHVDNCGHVRRDSSSAGVEPG